MVGGVNVGTNVAVTSRPAMLVKLVEHVTTRPAVDEDGDVLVHGSVALAIVKLTVPSVVPGLGPEPPRTWLWSVVTVAFNVTVSRDAAVVPGVGVLTSAVFVGAGFTTRGLNEPKLGVYWSSPGNSAFTV